MSTQKHNHRFMPWRDAVTRPWRVASEWVSRRLGYAPYYFYFDDIAPSRVRCELRDLAQAPRREPDYRLLLPPPEPADAYMATVIRALDLNTELAIWGDFELLCRVSVSGETECWRIPMAISHQPTSEQLAI